MMIIGKRRRLTFGIGAAVVAIALGAAMPAMTPPAQIALAPGPATGERSDISVMTYNVQGLPFPLAIGRDADLERIGARLAAYRRAGRQPGIVVLQEAFTDAAKRIGAIAGYRYIVVGPATDVAPATDGDPAHLAFLRGSSALAGEGIGKTIDSGLLILSDYPILAVRRAPFPAHACAGFDCLANKGVVMALVRLPGISRPVAIITTHLNARTASGVSLERANQAYRWQVETFDGFVRAARAMDVPAIVAGDLNVGYSLPRRALMHSYATRWSGGREGAGGTLAQCVAAGPGCSVDRRDDVRASLERNKDWQIALPGGGIAPRPNGIDVPFGREADGSMFSDHAGYVVRYRLAGSAS